MSKKEAKGDRNIIPDDKNPAYIFCNTHTNMLVLIAAKKINARKLALEELRKRGVDKEGKWVGFKR